MALDLAITPPASNLTPYGRERWRPRMRTGFLNLGDRRFYLYEDKQTFTLSSIKVTRFTLEYWPDPYGEISVWVSGDEDSIEYPFWFLNGNELIVAHVEAEERARFWGAADYDLSPWDQFIAGANAFLPESEVRIEYQTWDPTIPPPTDGTIERTDREEVLRFSEGTAEYWLPDYPAGAAPVVVTDDLVSINQANRKSVEYRIDSSEELINRTGDLVIDELRLRARVILGVVDNFARNPSFDRFVTILGINNPEDWQLTTAQQAVGPAVSPFHGDHVLYSVGGGWAQQQIPRTGEQITVSGYARAITGTVDAIMGANFISGTDFIDVDGNTTAPVVDDSHLYASKVRQVSTGEWTRLELKLGQTDAIFTSVDTGLPSVPYELLVRLGGTGVMWDGVQVQEGLEATDFAYIDDEQVTIEYEAGTLGIYTPDNESTYPYDIADVDANPINMPMNRGFLAWKGVQTVDDYRLGRGGEETEEEAYGWYSNTGVGWEEELIDSFDANGVLYIEENSTGTPTPTTGEALAYIDASGITGVASAAIADGYKATLLAEAQSALDRGFAGILIDVGDAADPSPVNLTAEWSRILTEIHDDITTSHPFQDTFGVHNGFALFDTGVAGTGLPGVLDVLVVDGAVQGKDLVYRSGAERRRILAQAVNSVQACYMLGNMAVSVLGRDFVRDDRDQDLVAEARHVAATMGWDHAVQHDPPLFFEARLFTPPLVPPEPFQEISGETFGRKHLPYARIDGVGKLTHRPTFRKELPSRWEVPNHDVEPVTFGRMDIVPWGTAYRDVTGVKAVNIGLPTGVVDDLYHYQFQYSVLITDAYENPIDGALLHLSLSTGNMEAPNGESGQELELYTDQAGAAYVTVTTPDTVAENEITVEARRFGKTESLKIVIV